MIRFWIYKIKMKLKNESRWVRIQDDNKRLMNDNLITNLIMR